MFLPHMFIPFPMPLANNHQHSATTQAANQGFWDALLDPEADASFPLEIGDGRLLFLLSQ